jgi:very-short-patch-repair endonuclease
LFPKGKFPILSDYARRMRRIDTRTEKIAWIMLRDRRTFGLKFRRQVPIDCYIVDFYCHELLLIIELDGMAHDRPEVVEHDAKRNQRLDDLGYRVLHVNSEILLNDPEALTEMIRACLPSPGPSGHPLPKGEGTRD